MPGQNEYGHCGKNCPKQGPTKPSNQELSELLFSRTIYSIYNQVKSFNSVERTDKGTDVWSRDFII